MAKTEKTTTKDRLPIATLRVDTGKPEGFALLAKALPPEGHHLWDNGQSRPVPQDLINNMAVEGAEQTDVCAEGTPSDFIIYDGRTRVRAIPEVNKQRARLGKTALVFNVKVFAPSGEEMTPEMLAGRLAGLSLNANRKIYDGALLAREVHNIVHWADATGMARAALVERLRPLGVKSEEHINELYALAEAFEVHKGLEEALRTGQISHNVAIAALKSVDANKADNLKQALEAAAASGKRVTGRSVGARGPKGSIRLSAKETTNLIEAIKQMSNLPALVREVACTVLDATLDERMVEKLEENLLAAVKHHSKK